MDRALCGAPFFYELEAYKRSKPGTRNVGINRDRKRERLPTGLNPWGKVAVVSSAVGCICTLFGTLTAAPVGFAYLGIRVTLRNIAVGLGFQHNR